MEHIKQLIKKEIHLLQESQDYADCYIKAMNDEDMLMADLYKSLADLHLQGYDRVRSVATSYISKKRTTEPMIADVYSMVKEISIDIYEEIKKKLMR